MAEAASSSALHQIEKPGIWDEGRVSEWSDGESLEAYEQALPSVLAGCRRYLDGPVDEVPTYRYSVERMVGMLFEFFVSEEAVDGYDLDEFRDIGDDPEGWLDWAETMLNV